MDVVQTATPRPLKQVILPEEGWVSLQLGELARYRELLYFLIWRDVKVRYKQTILGAAWAVIQPFCNMLVFALFFGHLAGLGPQDGSYPLWCFSGMVVWTFFATGLTQSANSLVGSANLVKKVYFPRIIIPTAAILAGVLDFLVAFAVLLAMLAYHGQPRSTHQDRKPQYEDPNAAAPAKNQPAELLRLQAGATDSLTETPARGRQPAQVQDQAEPTRGKAKDASRQTPPSPTPAPPPPSIHPALPFLCVPLFFLLALVTCLGAGFWLSALNAQFRDIRFTVPFLVQIWMFCTPLAYPSSLIPESWQALYNINPMVGVVEGLRWALLGQPAPGTTLFGVSALVAFALFMSGAFYFRRMEQKFADLV